MTTTATTWDRLAGQYRLRPGQQPGVIGQRPVLEPGRLAQLLAGQRGEQVGATLSSVFTLCAHAHRRAAALALAATRTDAHIAPPAEPLVLLWLETARDHLRAIALDWLPDPGTAPDLAWLRGCPLPLASAKSAGDAAAAWQTLHALRAWLQERILHQPVSDWLRRHRHPEALATWCAAQARHLAPARHLANWHARANALAPASRFLEVLDRDSVRQTAQLQQLGQAMANDASFAQQPLWLGQCAETGPWARLRHRPTLASSSPLTAWTRLAARWLELMEIAAASAGTEQVGHADNAPLLSSGALPLADGQALAWCEMARGLLLHWVQLDVQGGVQDYRVLAPTEWNFHPAGALARAVAALSPDDTPTARILAAAYDPCVACTV